MGKKQIIWMLIFFSCLFLFLFSNNGFSTEPFTKIWVNALYQPVRYGGEAYETGYDNFYCTPNGFSVGVYHLLPRYKHISLTIIHSGGTVDAGSYERPRESRAWSTFIAHGGAWGYVKVKAVVRPDSSSRSLPTLTLYSNTLYIDAKRPTLKSFHFRNVNTSPEGGPNSFRSPVVAVFGEVKDDVPWDKFTYHVAIDGNYPGHTSYISTFRITLREGRHDYSANVIDGRRRAFGWIRGKIIIDNTQPSVSFNKPVQNQKVLSGALLKVEIIVGDMLSGLRSVRIYLDSTTNKPVKSFRGPWATGFGKKETCTVRLIKTGQRKIYAVAQDRAGNRKVIYKTVQVKRKGKFKRTMQQ